MLLQLREFIRKEGMVSTQQLTRAFHLELSALQPMLDIWVKKGDIKKSSADRSCKSACFKCRTVDYYTVSTTDPSLIPLTIQGN